MPTVTTRSVRREVADDLVECCPPEWDVYPYGVALDVVDAPTALVVLDRVTRPDDLPLGTRRHEFTVWLIEPTTDPGAADDALDDSLDTLLSAVDARMPDFSWSAAIRDVYRDALPAYRLTLTRED